MEIRQMLVDSSKYNIKCPYSMSPTYITIHNTANDASANNEVSYMRTNNNQVSFHLAVDEKEVVQGIPFNRNAWHCGDGSGVSSGNRTSIGIEICYSKSGGDKYYQAEDNAVKLTGELMKTFNIPIDKVVQHYKWSGKNCPHRMREEGRWDGFITKVKSYVATGIIPPTGGGGGDVTPSTTNVKGYRVVTGSYTKKENAEAQVNKLKKVGFDSFILPY